MTGLKLGDLARQNATMPPQIPDRRLLGHAPLVHLSSDRIRHQKSREPLIQESSISIARAAQKGLPNHESEICEQSDIHLALGGVVGEQGEEEPLPFESECNAGEED